MIRELNIYPLRIESQRQAKELLQELGVWREGVDIMAAKSQYFALKVGPLPPQAVQILKQEMLSKGGEVATSGEVLKGRQGTYAVLFGTRAHFQRLLPKLNLQPFGLVQLGKELSAVIENLSNDFGRRVLECRGKRLYLGKRTLVMGILNLTPDSFSKDGIYADPDRALERALQMEEEGADIIDIGGESTRPGSLANPGENISDFSGFVTGSPPVSADEEISRLLPVLKRVAGRIRIPISVDTYKSEVARAALDNGANLVNDISGLKDPNMAGLVAEYGVPVIIMHGIREECSDIMEGIIRTLRLKTDRAVSAGIPLEHIILDPGIGFAKDTRQNLEIINRLDTLKCLGQPILIGTSRKSVIGNTLGLPIEERVEGTSATVAVGIIRGADIIRVHDVKEMLRVAKMADAILGRESDDG